jgi:hypothetical protein
LGQRKVVSPNDFHTLDEVKSRLLDFQQYYEQVATPFEWKFTKNDLNALLERVQTLSALFLFHQLRRKQVSPRAMSWGPRGSSAFSAMLRR